ncbi:MAG: ABC transporter ATP-binding protein [Bacillota bacterium]|nr:ABC transporter ATP-binding protein [Bacillota bacterium]
MSPRPKMEPRGPAFSKKNIKYAKMVIKDFFWWIILVVILEAGSVVLAVFAPQFLKALTDEVAQGAGMVNLDTVTRNGIILACMYGGNALLQYVAAYIMTTIAQKYSKKLRSAIQGKINRLPLSYFDSHQFGDILSRLTNDVDSVSNTLSNSLASIVHATLLLIGSTLAMFLTSWQMALSVVATLPILLIVAALDIRIVSPLWRKRAHILGDMEGEAEEQYSGQNIIKLFNAEERMVANFNEKNESMNQVMVASDAITSLIQPFYNFMSYAAYAAMGLTGGLLLVNGDGAVTIGTITAFMSYVSLFQTPLSEIGQSFSTLQSGLAANARISDFMQQEEEPQEKDKPFVFADVNKHEAVKGEVIFDHVNFAYDSSRDIIHDFSAHIKPGSKVAIVGPTGAGKTTMVNLLMRFYDVKGGDILIDGVSTQGMRREEIRDIFGMVLQDTWLFEGTLRENLVYNTPNVTDEQVKEAIKQCHLRHYVKTLPGGLDYEIKDVSSISAGEKQLITICRACIRKAPLLILDEATSNVDTRTEERIQEAMDRLTEGRTSFVIAHRLSTIRNANLILVMRDGNIVEQGDHESLMAQNGFYASLYNSQFAFE